MILNQTLIVKSQAEFDQLSAGLDESINIVIDSLERIYVSKKQSHRLIEVRGKSKVVAWGKARLVAKDQSEVFAWGFSQVKALGSSKVEAKDNAVVLAKENSQIFGSGHSKVSAFDCSHVTACDQAELKMHSSDSKVLKLLDWARILGTNQEDFSECLSRQKKNERPKYSRDSFFSRCETEGDSVILYKSVNPETLCDFHSGKIKYQGVIECEDWVDDEQIEAGHGFHLSPTPGDALYYRFGKLLRCRVRKEDINVFPNDITKVRCRRVEVLD
jgi:hypothetical protein